MKFNFNRHEENMFLTKILIGVYYKFKISLTKAKQMFIFV